MKQSITNYESRITNYRVRITNIIIALSLTLLAACGGGSNNSATPPKTPITPIVNFSAASQATALYGKQTTINVTADNTDFTLSAANGAGCAKNAKTIVCNPTAAGVYTVTATASANNQSINITVTVPSVEIEGLNATADGKYELALDADDTGSEEITFYAAEDWTAEISAGTGGVPSWIRIKDGVTINSTVTTQAAAGKTTTNGSAGKVSISFNLEQNNTGAERKATIKITVGNSIKEITIVQSPTGDSGEPLKKEIILDIKPNTQTATTGSSRTFMITTENTDFTFTVSPTIGHGCTRTGSAKNIVCKPTVAPRTYEITVTATEDTTITKKATMIVSVPAVDTNITAYIMVAPTRVNDIELSTPQSFNVTINGTTNQNYTFTTVPATGANCIKSDMTIICTPSAEGRYELTVTMDAATSNINNKRKIVIFNAIEIKGGLSELKPETLNISLEGTSGIDMILAKAGTFDMGCNIYTNDGFNYYVEGLGFNSGNCASASQPKHKVTLTKDFYIGKYEVSQAQWNAVMEIAPGTTPSMPKTGITWVQVQEFITKLNARDAGNGRIWRLLTEAEWEYAARGGHKKSFCDDGTESATYTCMYNGSNLSSSNIWYNCGTTCNKAHPVDELRFPESQNNELGLYNMVGNVGEWVNDLYGAYAAEAQTNPTGASTGANRGIRGGNYSSASNAANVFYRGNAGQTTTNANRGFRLALTVD